MRHGMWKAGGLAFVVVGAWCLAGAVGASPPGAQKGLAAQAAAQAEAEEWGEARDGLQIKLALTSRPEVRYGGFVSFETVVRNVSDKPIEFNLRASGNPYVGLGDKRSLSYENLGGSEAVPFLIDPGQELVLPGGQVSIRILPPGGWNRDAKSGAVGANNGPSAVLLPGDYTLDWRTPLWMVDEGDSNAATGHRARPNPIRFTVRGPLPSWPRAEKAEIKNAAPMPGVVWGEVVSGLQAGVAVPQAGKAAPGDQVPFSVLLRNTLDRPLSVSFARFRQDDWRPWVKDAKGKDQHVPITYVSGFRGSEEATLRPGEVRQIGESFLTLLPPAPEGKEREGEAKIYTPTLAASPGRCTMALIASVRFADVTSFHLGLTTGRMPFDVPTR